MSSLFLLFVGSAGFRSMNLNMLFFVVFFFWGVSEEFTVEHGTLTTTLVNFHGCIFFPNLLRWIVLPRAWWFFLLFSWSHYKFTTYSWGLEFLYQICLSIFGLSDYHMLKKTLFFAYGFWTSLTLRITYLEHSTHNQNWWTI